MSKSTTNLIVVIAALTMLAAVPASAAILASYDIAGGSGASSGDVGISNPGLLSAVLGPDEGSGSADAGLSGSTSTAFLRSDATGATDQNDQTGALSDDDYFEFTVDALPDATLSLESLTFDLGASSTGPTINNTVYVQSSVGGFGSANPVVATRSSTTGSTGGAVSANPVAAIDLTGGTFDGLSSVTFRFYIGDDQSNSGVINRLDNFVLNGTSPEIFPSLAFNDISAGDLNGQLGQIGMTGDWQGSTTIDVISGDLTAPVSTNFGLTQTTPTAQSVMGTENDASGRAISRQVAEPLTGTVWFSFLLNQPDAAARGGIDLNPSLGSTGPSGIRFVAVGDDLRLIGGGLNETVANVFALGQTSLILGKIVIDGAGNEELSIWIDPDVLNLLAPDFFDNTTNFIGAAGITTLGIESYTNGGTAGGTVDLITFSDRATAFNDVTGIPVPAPAALPVGLLGLVTIAARRSRRR